MTTFQLAHTRSFGSTSIYINLDEQRSIVNYVYGFSSDSFSYIATVQRANTSSDLYITKLIRVCQNDKTFKSYTEVELICKYNSAKYNLLQAARIAKPGKSLAKALGISVSKDVLFATFSQGKYGTTDAVNATAVCIYSLYTIKKIFTHNIQSCFDGLGNTGPDHLTDRTSCKRTAFSEIRSDYCGNFDFNYPIDGLEPISAKAALILNTKVSSITVGVLHDYTVGFIGTQDGHIIKVITL
ncbi:plexin-A3-like [Mytilus californianus]|uniref:plexin-A3-like n=1 Tax=Mytilus californianus TaxID=6549 RepID=UPI00224536F7|nr:plexin-A3-like [Mytilus californianus]